MRPPAYWEPRFGWRMLNGESYVDFKVIHDLRLLDLKRITTYARRRRIFQDYIQRGQSTLDYIVTHPGILVLEFEDRQCGFVHDGPRAATWFHMNVTQELLHEMEEIDIASADEISYVHDAAGEQTSPLAGLRGARLTATAIYKIRTVRRVLAYKERYLGLHLDDGAGGGIILGNYLHKRRSRRFKRIESALQVYAPAEIAPENIEETIRIN